MPMHPATGETLLDEGREGSLEHFDDTSPVEVAAGGYILRTDHQPFSRHSRESARACT